MSHIKIPVFVLGLFVAFFSVTFSLSAVSAKYNAHEYAQLLEEANKKGIVGVMITIDDSVSLADMKDMAVLWRYWVRLDRYSNLSYSPEGVNPRSTLCWKFPLFTMFPSMRR